MKTHIPAILLGFIFIFCIKCANAAPSTLNAGEGVTTHINSLPFNNAPSKNDYLSSITLKPFESLTTVAGPGYRNYTATVANLILSIKVIPVAADPTATIKVNGLVVASGAQSATIPLNVGANTITIVVTAQDGVSTKTYYITVTRQASASAQLSGLRLSNGAVLAPAFAPATTSYTSSVANGISTINVTPTTNSPGATIKVNGVTVASGTASGAIPLVVGNNTIKTIVTSQDGSSSQTYTVVITRAGPGNGNTYTWTGAGANNSWSNNNNWSPSTGFPVAGDFAIIGTTANTPMLTLAANCSTVTITGSTTITTAASLNITNGLILKAPLTVSGLNGGITSLSLTVSAGGSLTNSRPFTVNTGNISLASSTFIKNLTGGIFNVTGSPSIDLLDNAYISNTGTVNIAGVMVQLGKSGYISNTGSGVFTINGNTIIDFATNNANGASIQNSATFYAGTSNSKCTINLNYTGVAIQNAGTFYLGSTSVINLTGGSAFVGNTGTFTLQSDVNGCAAIGNITGSSAGCFGTYNVERFVTGGSSSYRAYRLVSSPVNDGTINGNTVYSLNYVKQSSYITGTTGTAGGFDNTSSANPTLYLFRENITPSNATFTSGNYRGVNDITAAPSYSLDGDGSGFSIPRGNGFLFFFRGDRSAASFATETSSAYVPTNATLTSKGSLNQGQIAVKDWYTPASANLGFTNTAGNASVQGFNLVGNPYPSAIDWDTYNTSSPNSGIYGPNLNPFIYVLDPVSKAYNVYIAGTGGVGTIASSGSNIIPSGQGFFVVAANPSAKLVFNESAKTDAQANAKNGNLFMGTQPPLAATQYFNLRLLQDEVNIDGILVKFNNNAKPEFVVNEDAIYKPGHGSAVSLSSMSADGVALAINTTTLPKTGQETIALNVDAQNDGDYKLNLASIKNIPGVYDIWLMDAYKKDSVDIKRNPTYSFSISKNDDASFGASRFSLVIRENPALMMHLLNFTAAKANSGAEIVWKTENEQNYTNFTIERSSDGGQNYTVLGGFVSGGLGTYSFTDKNPPVATNNYRLKLEDLNGAISYSNVVTLSFGNGTTIAKSNLNIYPNPASNTINLAISATGINVNASGSPLQDVALNPGIVSTAAAKTEYYDIKIINITGFVVKTATTASPTWQNNVSNLLPGTYIVQVLKSSDKSLVGKSTFVKL